MAPIKSGPADAVLPKAFGGSMRRLNDVRRNCRICRNGWLNIAAVFFFYCGNVRSSHQAIAEEVRDFPPNSVKPRASTRFRLEQS